MSWSKRILLLISYSYTIALSGLFELYARGGCLNHEAKSSGTWFKRAPRAYNSINHDKALGYSIVYDVKQLVSISHGYNSAMV